MTTVIEKIELGEYRAEYTPEKRDAYRIAQRQLTEQFMADALRELNLLWLSPELQTKLFDRAWDEHHSEGLEMVYQDLEELAEIVNDIARWLA